MDVHIPRAISTGLRLRNIDVLTSQEDNTTMLDDYSLLKELLFYEEFLSLLMMIF